MRSITLRANWSSTFIHRNQEHDEYAFGNTIRTSIRSAKCSSIINNHLVLSVLLHSAFVSLSTSKVDGLFYKIGSMCRMQTISLCYVLPSQCLVKPSTLPQHQRFETTNLDTATGSSTHIRQRQPLHSHLQKSAFRIYSFRPQLLIMPQQKKMENTKKDRAKQAKQQEEQKAREAAKVARTESFKRRPQSNVHHCPLKGKEKENCLPGPAYGSVRDICLKHEVFCRSCLLAHLKTQPCGKCGTRISG